MKKRSLLKLCVFLFCVLVGVAIWFLIQKKMFEFYILLAIVGVIMAMAIMILVLILAKSGLFKEMAGYIATIACDSIASRKFSRKLNELEKQFNQIDKFYDELEDLEYEIEQSDSSKEDERKLVGYIDREKNDLETNGHSMTEKEKDEKKSLIDDMEKTLNEIRDDIISEEEKERRMLRIAELKQTVLEIQKEARAFYVVQSEKVKKQIDQKSQYLILEAKKIAKRNRTPIEPSIEIKLEEAFKILENENGFKLVYTKESLMHLQEELEEVQEMLENLNDNFKN